MSRLLVAVLCALPALAAAAPVVEVHYVMGTYFRITAEPAARPAMRRCFQEARRLEAVFSRFDPASELTRVNAATRPLRVGPDFARLLARSHALGAATDGAFDVTIGAVTELWRQGTPPPEALAAARAGVGAAHAVLRGDVLARSPGTRLDFDGIAKGWAVDACVRLLRAAGVRSALVSLGESSLAALGRPADGPDWILDVRGADPETRVGHLHLRDVAASVSATYGSTGRQPGRPGHIVDPRSGAPISDEAVGVVVARTATDAEAYSKAILIWGAAGADRVESLGATGAIHVSVDGVHVGPRARAAGLYAPLAPGEPRLAVQEGRP